MTRRITVITALLIGLIIGYLAGCRSQGHSRTVTHKKNGDTVTLNEMRHIYPAYAAKERILQEQAEWAELIAQCKKIGLEEAQQRGIIINERSIDANGK